MQNFGMCVGGVCEITHPLVQSHWMSIKPKVESSHSDERNNEIYFYYL